MCLDKIWFLLHAPFTPLTVADYITCEAEWSSKVAVPHFVDPWCQDHGNSQNFYLSRNL